MAMISERMAETLKILLANNGTLDILSLPVSTLGALVARGLIYVKYARNRHEVTTVRLTKAGAELAPNVDMILKAPGYFETMAKLSPQKKKEKGKGKAR